MKNIIKLSVLVASCICVAEAMDSSFEVVQFTGNDIRDNIISRDYSAKIKKCKIRSVAMYGGLKMSELSPKLYTCIINELLDIEIKREPLNTQNKDRINDKLINMDGIWRLLDDEDIIRMLEGVKTLLAKDLNDLLVLSDEKYKDYYDYYIQKIIKLEDYCKYACTQANCIKYNTLFKNSNEYFIFIGDNPYKEQDSYKIESILPREDFNQQTKLAIVIPGDVDGHSVLVGKHTFFRLFHCNEHSTQNMRIKIIFTSTNGKKVGLPSDLSCMFDDFQHAGNGFKVIEIDFSGVYFPEPIRNMSSMFRNCRNLTQLHLSNFDTRNVISMEEMFCFCQNLQELDLSNFNTQNVENMYRMFYKCGNLKALDLSNFDVSNVTELTDMFAGCKNLAKVRLKQSTLKQLLQQNEKLFEDCTNLQIIYA